MISVQILTFNESANLAACIESVAWCDDVLVVDSGSTDDTIAIARVAGARVLSRPFDTFAGQRNYGLDSGGLRHEWVLQLDADERVTPAGRVEMMAAIRSGCFDAYEVPAKLMFRGRWLRHAGMYPTYQVRLGLQAELRFVEVGHGQREALARKRVGRLCEPLMHYPFSKGEPEWIARHRRYAAREAEEAEALTVGSWAIRDLALGRDPVRRRRALKALAYCMPFRPFLRFVYMYVLSLGVLEGRPGYDYCMLMARYERMMDEARVELRRSRVRVSRCT